MFSPFPLKDAKLRNRVVMSPGTIYRSESGTMHDVHVMLMGSGAAGGFGFIFPEQIAITADGRTSTGLAGIWDCSQIERLRRVTTIIKNTGGVSPI